MFFEPCLEFSISSDRLRREGGGVFLVQEDTYKGMSMHQCSGGSDGERWVQVGPQIQLERGLRPGFVCQAMEVQILF